MRGMKLAGIGLVVLIVAVGLGFAWGASGRATAQSAVDGLRQQLDLAQARGDILDARVSLYNVNFGDAQRQLEESKTPLTRARDRAKEEGRTAAADALTKALGHVADAQRLAARLDQGANTRAGEAMKAISESSR
jgi:hypothetical protein